jgi:16S rRNA G966 N2-methylase RsmD
MSSRKRTNRSIDYTKLFLEPPNNKDYKRLMIDRESISYITTPHNAITIGWILISNLNIEVSLRDLTVFDATAGVGGDTIVFGQKFGKVIGCELDEKRFKMLENNVDVYDLSNVTVVNDDCLNLMFNLNYLDVVYMDPPWGGKSYKNEQSLTLSIGDKSIESIVVDLLDETRSKSAHCLKEIVFKLPKNYDLKYLYDQTRNTGKATTLLMYELEKMLILVFKID